jgi:TetR/AcrR family transcriptional repressor of mexJK operon
MAQKNKIINPPQPGRPKDLAKRADILMAAGDLFMKKGFGGTTMDDIASLANVSKLTVYNHFGSKENLFSEVICKKCDQFTGEDFFHHFDGSNPHKELKIIGNAFIDLIYSPEAVSMYRLMMTDGASSPELGVIFYKAGPQRLYERFIKYLSKLETNNTLSFPNKEKAATLFFDLFKGDLHMRALLNISPKPTKKDFDILTEDNVDFYLKAHRA